MQNYHKNKDILKELQQETADSILHKRTQDLKNVLRKNSLMVNGMPKEISSEGVKKRFLKVRKDFMYRQIQSEIRNKKVNSWTMSQLKKQQTKCEIMDQTERPNEVIEYLVE